MRWIAGRVLCLFGQHTFRHYSERWVEKDGTQSGRDAWLCEKCRKVKEWSAEYVNYGTFGVTNARPERRRQRDRYLADLQSELIRLDRAGVDTHNLRQTVTKLFDEAPS